MFLSYESEIVILKLGGFSDALLFWFSDNNAHAQKSLAEVICILTLNIFMWFCLCVDFES